MLELERDLVQNELFQTVLTSADGIFFCVLCMDVIYRLGTYRIGKSADNDNDFVSVVQISL